MAAVGAVAHVVEVVGVLPSGWDISLSCQATALLACGAGNGSCSMKHHLIGSASSPQPAAS